MIKTRGNLFRAVTTFVSVEPARYYLDGVFIEPHDNGALLVATDGHRLICVHDEDATCEKSVIVKLPHVMLAALDDRDLTIDENGHATIEGLFQSTSSVLIDGRYLDWRNVIGTFAETNGAFQSFSAKYLSAFAEMAGLLGDSAHRIVVVPGPAADAPALILFPGTAKAFGVLMPTRMPDKFSARLPEFIRSAKAAA